MEYYYRGFMNFFKKIKEWYTDWNRKRQRKKKLKKMREMDPFTYD